MKKPDLNDPRTLEGVPMPAFRPGVSGTIWWKVKGWNSQPRGGSCSYGACVSKEAAIRQAQFMREHGDFDNRKYEHYNVLEITFEVTATTTVHDVPEMNWDE